MKARSPWLIVAVLAGLVGAAYLLITSLKGSKEGAAGAVNKSVRAGGAALEATGIPYVSDLGASLSAVTDGPTSPAYNPSFSTTVSDWTWWVPWSAEINGIGSLYTWATSSNGTQGAMTGPNGEKVIP